MTLGDVIYKYRSQHGLSMDKFSELSGISKGYISMLEKKFERLEEKIDNLERIITQQQDENTKRK